MVKESKSKIIAKIMNSVQKKTKKVDKSFEATLEGSQNRYIIYKKARDQSKNEASEEGEGRTWISSEHTLLRGDIGRCGGGGGGGGGGLGAVARSHRQEVWSARPGHVAGTRQRGAVRGRVGPSRRAYSRRAHRHSHRGHTVSPPHEAEPGSLKEAGAATKSGKSNAKGTAA